MKIEMDEQSGIVTMVVMVILVAGICILGGCYQCEQTTREAIKAGLVQKQQTVAGMPVWSKP